MTGTTEETRPIGLTTRVTDALDALRARVRGGAGHVEVPRAGMGGIPPMPAEAPTVGASPGVGDEAFRQAGDEVPSGAGSRVPWEWREVTGGEDFFGPDTVSGVPPMPETDPVGGEFPGPVEVPVGAVSMGSVPMGSVPPMPEAAPTVGIPFVAEGDFSVPPMPEAPPSIGVPGAGDDHAFYDAPRPTPPVPPMPSAAPIVPPVPPYAPPAPAAADDGTTPLFMSPMDSRRLHKYPFCAPPLNQNTYGSRQRHRRVSPAPRQGRGVS
ncbi:hypothetical protein ACVNF4_19195 [Streptomyces sp. S6]